MDVPVPQLKEEAVVLCEASGKEKGDIRILGCRQTHVYIIHTNTYRYIVYIYIYMHLHMPCECVYICICIYVYKMATPSLHPGAPGLLDLSAQAVKL